MDKVKCSLWMLVCLCSISCSEVNVALKKSASSTSGSFITMEGTWSPSGAVDGDHDTLTSGSSCFHSRRAPADWTVDLGQDYQLYNIIVYIRIDWKSMIPFFDRTANSSIYVNNNPSRVCYTFPSTISDNPTYLTCNETARYVTIRNPGNEGFGDSLNICEVEIYACPRGNRGLYCNISCNCDECDRWTGVCYSSCRPGWEGERCDRACNGTYGPNCANFCAARHCCDSSSSCDQVSGTCDSRCLAGWTGHDCIKCPSSTYGLNCSKRCTTRHCLGWSTCNHVTGSCLHGCTSGWKSIDCTEACNGTYGPNCINSCAARHCINSSSSCDPVNGTCDSGCLDGWIGHDCISECPSSTYGLNCNKNCTHRHCLDSYTCDHVTGACDQGCEAGWKTIDCNEECTEGEEFGPSCSGSCNARHCLNPSSCHPVYGFCDKGCEAGWEGLQCQQAEKVPDVNDSSVLTTTDTGTIAFSITVGILVVIIAILSVLLIRTKLKQQSTDMNSTGTKRPTPVSSPTSDNIHTDITSSNTTSSTAPSTYETLQLTEDNHYTGLERHFYENA